MRSSWLWLLVPALLALACSGVEHTAPHHAAMAPSQATPTDGAPALHLVASPIPAIARTPAAPSSAATTSAPAGGSLLITRGEALLLRDIATGNEQQVLVAPQGVLVTYPAWAPDGSKFAFALLHPFAGRVNDALADWGSDLYVAGSSGGPPRELLKHDAPGAQFEAPTWAPDGSALLYSYLSFTYDARGQFTGQREQIRRLDLATGGVTTVLDDAADSDLCRTGAQLAFMRFDPLTNTRNSIGVADGEGGNPHTILAASAAIQNFLYPHFSPDCSQLVFAASATNTRLPSRSRAAASLSYRGETAVLHGLPTDIWTINVDGTGLRRLTYVNEDEPYPIWSSNGTSLFVLGTNGLYRVLPQQGDVTRIAAGSVLGQLALH
jgi:Tol biopolymer transport system component